MQNPYQILQQKYNQKIEQLYLNYQVDNNYT